MKKIATVCLVIALLICGCTNENNGQEPTSTTPADTLDVFDQIAIDAAEARANYYQKLVVELQQEILSLKDAHASAKVEYESRIEELEIALGIPEVAPPSDFRYSAKDGKITILAYVGSEKIVSVPQTIGDCPVTHIADTAFENNLTLEKVILPSSLESIGWFAFRGCIALREVQAPATLSRIDYGAFENCNATLTFVCESGSYAEEYAQSYGYATKKQ